MATFRVFEEIEAWKKARLFVREIYQVTSRGPFSRDYGLRDQIRRAAISILSNIAEGSERDGAREFHQFLSIAKGSIGELRSHLYIASDQGYMTDEHLEALQASATEIGRMVGGLMAYLRSTEIKGVKYRKGSPGLRKAPPT